MKRTYQILSLIIVLFLFSSNVQAKKRVGLIVVLDTMITHQKIGVTVLTNFIKQYNMPFDLKSYCEVTAQEVFASEYGIMDLVVLDRIVFDEYKIQKNRLSRREFKKFSEEWIGRIKSEYNIDGVLFITSTNFPSVTTPKLGGIGLFNSAYKEKNAVFIPISLELFWNSTSRFLLADNQLLFKDDLPKLNSGKESLTDEMLIQLELPLQELLKSQLIEMKKINYL